MVSVVQFIKKTVCTVVSASIAVLPGWALGEETNMSAIGKAAQKEASEMAGFALGYRPSMSGNEITLPTGKNNTIQIDKDALVPTEQNSGMKYATDSKAIDNAKSIYEDGSRMTDEGEDAKERLYLDSVSEKPSVEGMAYGILVDAQNRNLMSTLNSNDPMFKQTKEVQNKMSDIVKELSECKADTVFKSVTSTKRVPSYQVCSQVLDRSGSCTIYHNYQAGVVQHYEGPYNLDKCGEGCTQLWIGKVGDNYWGGSCAVYEQHTTVKVPNPAAVTRAVLEYAKWDDYMIVMVGEPGKEEIIWTGPYDWRTNPNYFPPETPGRCELSTSWSQNPNVDVTRFFKNVKKGAIVRFKIRASVTGGGEAFGRIKIYFNKSQAVHDESWTPTNCLEAAYGIEDGFAKGTIKCVNNPQESDGCAWIDGVHVCNSDLKPSPLKNIPALCKKVEVNADFNFYKGEMDCYTDIEGNRQCPVNTGGNLDPCAKYEKDPNCGFIKSECLEGAKGASGQCYVNDVTYDCGQEVTVTDTESKTEYNCAGPIKCMGNECTETSFVKSTDFGKVTALMNAAQYMVKDMTCTGQDAEGNFTGQENVSCTVFAGEAKQCKIAVGGVSNCCESQPGIGLASYIGMIKGAADFDASMVSMTEKGSEATGIVKEIAGQYVDIRGKAVEVVKDGIQYITKPFSSYVDNAVSTIKEFYNPAKEFIKKIVEDLTNKCQELLTQLFQDAAIKGGEQVATGSMATKAGTEATGALANIGMAFSVISAIYTAYMVAMMVIQIVYKCEEEEYELTAQRDVNNCHYIGSYCKNKKLGVCIEKRQSYCCYKSPLSRILNEQIRMQGDVLGSEYDGFGSAKAPKCKGIPVDKIDKIDWDRVDLSEWIAILETTGNMTNTEDQLTLNALTGVGSNMDLYGDRLNTLERIEEKLTDVDTDGVRTETAKEIEVDTGYRGNKY